MISCVQPTYWCSGSVKPGARRQLTLDGYNEDAHRQLIRALAFDGQRNRTLAHYAEYAKLLEEELGVAPDIRTTALYQRIRDRRLQPHSQPVPASPGATTANIAAVGGTLFVGREAELARLEAALQQAQRGAGQVRFITGEAGSGKSMLVQAFAHSVLARADDIVVARGVCNAQIGAGDPYLPFREILRLLRGLAGSRLLLIGLYRPVERAPDHPLISTVHELQRMHGDIFVDLDQTGGEEFVDAFLDEMPNAFEATFHAQLARQTGGHALFTAALIQQMQGDGTLVRDAEGRWRVETDLDWSQMPPRVEAVIAKRLARLRTGCPRSISVIVSPRALSLLSKDAVR